MSNFKNLLWVSLTLLLVTHTILGWQLSAFLASASQPVWVVSMWAIIIGADLLLAVAISSPWSQMRDSFATLFKSDTRAFLFAVAFAFLSVVIITWLHVFIHILVVMSAAILVRLDTQTAKWTIRQSFLILTIFSLVGLGIGAGAQALLEGLAVNG